MSKTFDVSGPGWDAIVRIAGRPVYIVRIAGRPVYYRLDGHEPVPAARDEFARMFEDNDARRVASTMVGEARVSTVFLAIDHNFGPDGPPILFETMVFGLDDDREYQWRYATWDEAAAGHEAIVAALRDGTGLPE